jgi:ATP-dependent helicase HrpB
VVQQAFLFVAGEIRDIGDHNGEVKTVLSLATEIEAGWLKEFFNHELREDIVLAYDSVARRVVADKRILFRDLEIEKRRMDSPPADDAARLLAAEVLAGRLALVNWDHGIEQWILRLNSLASWCPEFELPPIKDEDRAELVVQVCHGASSYREIKERPVRPLVRDWLNLQQQRLVDDHAPERLQLSNGRQAKLTYVADGPPHLSLRIQELYDVAETPRIALGRIAVAIHILAPNMRPVQVTSDLSSFWKTHYPRVKSELQRRYPKHVWR